MTMSASWRSSRSPANQGQALLMSTSTTGASARVCWQAFAMLSGLPRSHGGHAQQCPVRALIVSATRSSVDWQRPRSTTSAPRSAAVIASARPKPRAAPVITIRLPDKVGGEVMAHHCQRCGSISGESRSLAGGLVKTHGTRPRDASLPFCAKCVCSMRASRARRVECCFSVDSSGPCAGLDMRW